MIERPPRHVLACVPAGTQADLRGAAQDHALVAHARHLATALACGMTVLPLADEDLAAADDRLLDRLSDAVQAHGATALLISAPVHRRAGSGQGTGPRRGHSPAATAAFARRLKRALPAVAVHVIDDASPGASASTAAGTSAGAPQAASPWSGGATALGALAACTAVAWLLAPWVQAASLIMVYLVGVVHVALRAARPVALLTVFGSVLLYDLLFIAPGAVLQAGGPRALPAGEPHYLLVSLVMLLVGFIVSQLGSRARQQTAMAQARAQRAQALNHLALELVKARSPAAIGLALALAVHRALGASAKLLVVDDAGRLVGQETHDGAPHGAIDPHGAVNPLQARLAAWALQAGCDTGAGTAVEPGAPLRCLPLLSAEGALGVVAVDLLAREHDTPEDRHLLRTAANQVAVALDRAVFEQRSARDAVQAERERLRNTLLAGVSHDFRTPLTTIVGAVTSLIDQGGALDAAQHDGLLRSVLAEAGRLHALTSNLLDLTRLQEGAIQPRPEWCPADELIEEARAALGVRLSAHALAVHAAPDAVVWCDPRLVGQLLVNLLDNATRHAPGAAIRIELRVAADHWQLVVADDGPGVPAGQEREVFSKFFRGAAGADTGTGHGTRSGTGLGLAICAAVAQLHGGTLTVDAGPGARFVLTMPQPPMPVKMPMLEEAG